MVDGGRELSGVLFIGALISFMTAPPSRSTHLPKPYPLTLSPWELGSQHINFAGTQTFRREQVDTNGDSTLNISESCQLLPTVALPLTFLPAMNCCGCCCSISKLFPPHGLQHAKASLSLTVSQGLLKFMFTELVMPSHHLILCHPLLLLPSIFPSIRVFSNESALRIR